MARDSKSDLNAAGIPPHEQGANSPHGLVQAYHLISEHDLTALLVPSPKRTGSVDELLATHALFGDGLELRMTCERGSVWGITFPRERDIEYLQKDLGALPRTWMSKCAACKGVIKWFAANPDGPDLKVGERIHATNARLLKSVPVPGSRWRIDPYNLGDERHEWVEHREPWSVRLAELPPKWLRSLPTKNGLSITATPVARSEYVSPYNPKYTG